MKWDEIKNLRPARPELLTPQERGEQLSAKHDRRGTKPTRRSVREFGKARQFGGVLVAEAGAALEAAKHAATGGAGHE